VCATARSARRPAATLMAVDWPLLDVLSAEQRRRLLSHARRRRFKRGEVVFHEGDPGDALHLIDKGHVAVKRSTPLGDVAMLLVLGPGDVFGELAVVAPGPRNATVVPLDPVETLAVHREVFDDLRQTHPGIDRVLMHGLVEEVRRLSAMLVEAMYVPADKRIYLRLSELTRIFRVPGHADRVVIPLTQEELAQLAGTTRPTANRVLRSAEAASELTVARGRIEVLDPAAVARRSR
jgi:CRP-like cAMP-binding protein